MNALFDTHWPGEGQFLPPKPISSSALKGKPSACFIVTNLSSGGAERQAVALACELKKRGHEVRVRVLSLDDEQGHYLPYLKAHGVDVSVPPIPDFSDIKFMKRQGVDVSLIKHLPSELRIEAMALALDLLRRPADIAHCYLDWSCCYGGFAALLSGTPCVRFSWRNYNPTHFEFYRDWMPPLYEFLLRFSRIRVENNTSRGALDYTQWLGLPSGKAEVIPNGLAPGLFPAPIEDNGATLRQSPGVVSEGPVVVSIGRLLPQKRPLDLPDIFLALRKKLPSASLLHIGTGPLKKELEERMALAGLGWPSGDLEKGRAMFLLGRRDDAFQILCAADVLLLTSAYEGMPNVIMEAMYAGRPVVATRVGGVPDLIEDGVHGFIHAVGDTEGMARSLERLLTDPGLRQRMGKAGRERILSEFTIDHLADRITRAYAAQCSAARQGAGLPMRFPEKSERFWRALRAGNFSGLWLQCRRALGLRGPVPAPSMPEPNRRFYLENDACEDVSLGIPTPRLLVFSHDLNLEGAAISLFEMILALKQRGVADPEVITFKDGPLRAKYEAAGILVSIFSCDPDGLSTVRRLDEAVRALAELIRQKRPDVVFANTLRSFLAILAAKEARIHSVWNVREGAPWNTFFCYLPDPVAQRAIAAISLPYRVVFVSHASRKIWAPFDRYGNFDVIHNGIDLSRFPQRGKAAERERSRASLGLEEGAVAILSLGTINARKGQKDLVEAVALLPRPVLERVQILLVGDDRDPYAADLKKRCRALPPDVRQRIRFFQPTDQVQPFYGSADIFVLCSRQESFPRVTLEAMAFGLPIIATPVHGVIEQCVEGENAFFYPNGNIKDLAGKIELLIKNEILRKQMGQNSSRRLSRLKPFEEMTDAYASILFKAAGKRPAAVKATQSEPKAALYDRIVS